MTEIDDIARALCNITELRTMRKFIYEVFTPAEIQDVALRWRLMQMLSDGVTQRKIADDLGISLCKITRGSKVLKAKGSVSKRLLENSTGGENASRKKTSRAAES